MTIQLTSQNKFGSNNPVRIEAETKRKEPTKAMRKLANELRRELPDYRIEFRTV